MNTSGHRMPVLNHFLCYSISRDGREHSLKGVVRYAGSFLHVSERAVHSSSWLFIWFIYLQTGKLPSGGKGGRFHPDVYRDTEVTDPGNTGWLVTAVELDSYLSNLSSPERQWDGQQPAPLAQVEIGRQLYLNIIFDCKDKQTKTHSGWHEQNAYNPSF